MFTKTGVIQCVYGPRALLSVQHSARHVNKPCTEQLCAKI